MGFPPQPPFNPPVSSVPNLGPSSGNPKSFQDPKSVASVGAKLQAMTDQAVADTLYDAKKEGFTGHYSQGISRNDLLAFVSGIVGIVLIIRSF